jgi:FkbM family methyltransferase
MWPSFGDAVLHTAPRDEVKSLEHRARRCYCSAMNFDDALKHYLPRAWFRFKFLKYKYAKRGEPEIRLIGHLVEPGSTALDVGASIGIYAAEMARYADKVIAFEVNPQVADFARKVAVRNVEVVNMALSSAPGRATLKIPVHANGATMDELATIDPANPLQGRDVAACEVETKRLDDLAISRCSFIKIDVEGHEEAVLDGASNLIAAQRPILMIELDESLNKGALARLAVRYAALNYRAFFLSHGKLRPISEYDPARHQDAANLKPRHKLPRGVEYINNFVFVPEEKRARRFMGL